MRLLDEVSLCWLLLWLPKWGKFSKLSSNGFGLVALLRSAADGKQYGELLLNTNLFADCLFRLFRFMVYGLESSQVGVSVEMKWAFDGDLSNAYVVKFSFTCNMDDICGSCLCSRLFLFRLVSDWWLDLNGSSFILMWVSTKWLELCHLEQIKSIKWNAFKA